MKTEKILRNAEALANTVPDKTVQGLIRQAYIKGAKDNAVEDNTVNVEIAADPRTEGQTKADTEFEEAVYEILAEAVKRQGLDSDFYRGSCDRLLKLAKTCISLQSTQETDIKP